MKETREFISAINKLAAVANKLADRAATVAVNFSKARFREQSWIDVGTTIWKAKKVVKRSRDRGRATLVKTGNLRRDIKKLYVGRDMVIIGTSNLTGAYAKAHNEGFKGAVNVPAHERRRFNRVKEKYTTKKGNERTRTSKQVNTAQATIKVKQHTKNLNIPQRRFIGESQQLERLVLRQMTADYMKVLKTL